MLNDNLPGYRIKWSLILQCQDYIVVNEKPAICRHPHVRSLSFCLLMFNISSWAIKFQRFAKMCIVIHLFRYSVRGTHCTGWVCSLLWPSEGHGEADVAPGENELDTPALKYPLCILSDFLNTAFQPQSQWLVDHPAFNLFIFWFWLLIYKNSLFFYEWHSLFCIFRKFKIPDLKIIFVTCPQSMPVSLFCFHFDLPAYLDRNFPLLSPSFPHAPFTLRFLFLLVMQWSVDTQVLEADVIAPGFIGATQEHWLACGHKSRIGNAVTSQLV